MAEYPRAAFPNTPAWKHDTKKNMGLNGYGCWEGVNATINDGNVTFQAKNSRPAQVVDEAKSIVLTPLRKSFTQICNMPSEHGFKGSEKDHPSTRLQKKLRNKSKQVAVLPIAHSFANFVDKHSGFLIGDFRHFLKENRHEHSVRSWMKQKMKSKLPVNYFLRHFDPTSMGPGKKFISELLQDSQLVTLKDELNDTGCVGQGCLVSKDLHKNMDETLGLLVSAQGQGLDELVVRFTYTNSDINSNFNESERPPISIHIMGEVSQTLNGRIIEISATEYDQSDIMIATTSDHHVVLNTLHKDNITIDWDSKETSLPKKLLCSPCVIKSDGDSSFSSVALNPYLPGECAVSTKNGDIGLWKADVQNFAEFSDDVFSKLSFNYHEPTGILKQICFGAHPRQFCACDDSSVYLFDTRAHSTTAYLFDVTASSYMSKPEKVHGVRSCKELSNEFEVIVATDGNLFLFDLRHCQEPLLQWGSTCFFPTSYLKPIACTLEKHYTTSPMARWVCSNSVLLAGGRNTKDVHCYQLNRLTNISNEQKPISFPPQYIAPPRILSPAESTAKSSSMSSKIQSHLYTASANQNIIGFDAVPVQLEVSEGICVYQLTAGGEICYQILGQSIRNEMAGRNSSNFDATADFSVDDYGESEPVHDSNGHNQPLTLRNIQSNELEAPYSLLPSTKLFEACLSANEREMECCQVCIAGNSEEDESQNRSPSEILSAPCNHRSRTDDGNMTYAVENNYFHNQDVIPPELSLINLDTPNDTSELGKSLLQAWGTFDE